MRASSAMLFKINTIKMKFARTIFAGLLVLLCQQINAQDHSKQHTESWTSARPDGHAPISVMGDHYHHKGEFMVSYRFMFMNMEGLYRGDAAISNLQGHQAGYMVTPLKMPMNMHMLGVMYAPTDKITLMAMFNYLQNDMDLQMRMPTGMTRTFSTASSGLSDVKLGFLYKLLNRNKQSLHALVNLSIPTGSLEAKAATPMSGGKQLQLPYPMQLGSGTYDADLGLTYLGQATHYSWGTQLKGTYRFGTNTYGYRMGNAYQLNSWFAVKTTPWLSVSARVEGQVTTGIIGRNANLNSMMVTTADVANSGRKLVNTALGFNLYAFKGNLKNLRLGAEYVYPVYQFVTGVQLKQKESFVIGLQYSL